MAVKSHLIKDRLTEHLFNQLFYHSNQGRFVWLSASVTKTGGTDYTADGAWTDLDLSGDISSRAGFVILSLEHKAGCNVADRLMVRKNGEVAGQYPELKAQVNAVVCTMFCICAVDANREIEYYATDASSTNIHILGYIEQSG